jgi:hypothetical protein
VNSSEPILQIEPGLVPPQRRDPKLGIAWFCRRYLAARSKTDSWFGVITMSILVGSIENLTDLT